MRKERMSDQGFSLVELIIVVAIMAIMIVVLTPQYLRYVERSRNTADIQNATQMVTAVQVYASDPDAGTPIGAADNGAQIVIGQTAQPATVCCPNAAVLAALQNAGLDPTAVTCRSTTAWDSYTITINIDAATGNISFVYSSTIGGSAPTTDNFEQRMTGS